MIILSFQGEAGDAHSPHPTSLWQNLMVGAHNWPHISDTETTPVRAGSSAPPPHTPKEPAEGVQTSCNMDVSLMQNPISPWVRGAPLSTLPSQPACGIWGHWCRDSLSFSLLPSCLLRQTIRNACPQHQGLRLPPWTLLPLHLVFPLMPHHTTHAGRRAGQLTAALGHSRGHKQLHLPPLS